MPRVKRQHNERRVLPALPLFDGSLPEVAASMGSLCQESQPMTSRKVRGEEGGSLRGGNISQ